nr:methylmalonyl-CoA epimerase [Kibdelosporangium sp. MJ126-NF4]CEL21610.1 Methylmalonyl-CoA epimerase; Ethylmalonyl-CoA epimerase [Kibdelosporangium sp. MJ126-NF4]CTQ92391.1 Methylmalonyl-CoA epimerase (EC 5.1.99.1); Ethylmalonyl-CoA epimerase [Kibdelosporangium sp. MJ126-NF4]
MSHDSAAAVTAIDHIGIAVPDLDEAIEFYQKTFGLVLTVTEVNEEQGVREAMLRAPGDDGTGTAIQLLAPLTPESTIGKFLAKRGPGVQQVAYRVDDIEKASDAIREKGMSLVFDKPRHGTENSRTQFIHPKSAGGVLVELVEPAGP